MPISAYLKAIREKVGHDLVALTAASISVFNHQGSLLLGKDAETGSWGLPGGAIDPNEQPADAAVRECYEETGLLVRLDEYIGVFGGPEFLVHYPHGDVAYYTVIAFRASAIGGLHRPGDGEMSALHYFSATECDSLNLSPSSRVIAKQAFAGASRPYFRPASWLPEKDI
jgi:8-oxo-dGTP pyrophosphatase MutT (NUDIX family)